MPVTEAARAKLTRQQAEIYRAGWTAEARFRTAPCGRRFGKTFLGVEEVRRAAREAVRQNIHPDNEIWYGAPTFKQGKRVFWRRLKRAIPARWIAGKPIETDCAITLLSGHVIRIVGLDNYDNLRGSGLWFFLGDEWADAKPEAWTETIRPMLSTAQGHALFIGTPKGRNDFYQKFLLGQPGAVHKDGTLAFGWKSWTFTTRQGGNVPVEEIQDAKRNMGPREFRQEYEAGFEDYAGRVIYAFNRAENVRPCPYVPREELHVGMDFNVNPMTARVWQHNDGIDRQVGEVMLPGSNTDEMCDELQRRYGQGGALSHVSVYPDPAGAQRRTSAMGRTDIGILRSRGFRVMAMATHPLVRDRHNVTNARFYAADGTRRAFVDPACAKSIEAYERLSYRAGTNEPDKDGGFDHAVDATGYYLFGRYAAKPARTMATSLIGR